MTNEEILYELSSYKKRLVDKLEKERDKYKEALTQAMKNN